MIEEMLVKSRIESLKTSPRESRTSYPWWRTIPGLLFLILLWGSNYIFPGTIDFTNTMFVILGIVGLILVSLVLSTFLPGIPMLMFLLGIVFGAIIITLYKFGNLDETLRIVGGITLGFGLYELTEFASRRIWPEVENETTQQETDVEAGPETQDSEVL